MVRHVKTQISLLLSIFIALVVSGCNSFQAYLTRIDHQALEDYHESRWLAVANACVTSEYPYSPPHEPVTPRRCVEIESLYSAVIKDYNNAQKEITSLAEESEAAEQYLEELIDVLVNRDHMHIAELLKQLPDFELKLNDGHLRWQSARVQLSNRLLELDKEWEHVWSAETGQCFDLDLDNAVEFARQNWPELPSTDVASFEEYHIQQYSRLAMVYLGYEPDFTPSPAEEIVVPDNAEVINLAMDKLEAGLLVRFELDEAIEADTAWLSELTGLPLNGQNWAGLELPKKGWKHERAEAALARLHVYKRVDALLTQCLDYQQESVTQAWLDVWPNCPLELNVFSYSGLPQALPAPKPISDWKELTLRD